jgi:hypothetical protein
MEKKVLSLALLLMTLLPLVAAGNDGLGSKTPCQTNGTRPPNFTIDALVRHLKGRRMSVSNLIRIVRGGKTEVDTLETANFYLVDKTGKVSVVKLIGGSPQGIQEIA